MPIRILIGTTVVRIRILIGTIVVRIAIANEMQRYISISMKVKVGIIGKIEIRMQVSKMVYSAIKSDCFAVILLGTLP